MVFGRVLQGMGTVRRIEEVCGTADSGSELCRAQKHHGVLAFRPTLGDYRAVITDCGVLGEEEPSRKRQKVEEVQLHHMVKKFKGCRKPESYKGTEITASKAKARQTLRVRWAFQGVFNQFQADFHPISTRFQPFFLLF